MKWSRVYLKSRFETADTHTAQDFSDLIESCVNIVDDNSSGYSGYSGSISSIWGEITPETTPITPSSGNFKIYVKSDGKLYILDSNGNETIIGTQTV